MQVYEAIEQGIITRDVVSLRDSIGSICYTCRDFSDGEFDRIVEYVESKGIELKDSTLADGPTISSQKSEFTDDDFSRAIFELKRNFCDERIDDVKKIGRALYKNNSNLVVETEEVQDKKTERGEINSKNFVSHQTRKLNKKTIVLVAVVIAAIAILCILNLK